MLGSALRRALLAGARVPCARATLLCSQFAAWILEYPGRTTGKAGRRLQPGAGRGGAEPLGGLGRPLPQVPALGAARLKRPRRRSWSASPNPEFCARLLLEKGSLLSGRGCADASSPAWAWSQVGGERGRGGTAAPAGAGRWQELGDGVGRLVPTRVTDQRRQKRGIEGALSGSAPDPLRLREWKHIQVGRAPLHLGVSFWNCLGALPGAHCPCMACSGVARFSWLRFPGPSRCPAGEGEG